MISPVMRSRLLFGLSGAAALGLQQIWTRMFATGLGHEVPALLAVITAFLGGMALGAWMLDRRIAASPEPHRWFQRLQVVIALWTVAGTCLIPQVNQLAIAWIGPEASALRQGLVSFLVPFLTLLPATAAMGATLPAMEHWLAAIAGNERALANVYAWNTAGAVVGTLATA
ncbi:MAG: spermidine synthase, partial [Verrucomicrobiota bacterium]